MGNVLIDRPNTQKRTFFGGWISWEELGRLLEARRSNKII